MNTVLLELSGIEKRYNNGANDVRALDGVSLKIRRGEFVAIMGQSGSGKSTLMNILGCLDRPTAGSYQVLGREAAHLEADELAALRRETFGFVFQKYNLLATANAGENVDIPSVYTGLPKQKRVERTAQLLRRLGLGDRTEHRPSELSGGQQQRVAIARALVNDPPVILADEPTGALDSKSGDEVLALLKQLYAEGRTIVLITHAENLARHAERVVRIQDGRIFEDTGGSSDPASESCRADERSFKSAVGLAASYQKSVLTAFREVEDALAALRSANERTDLSGATVAESQNAYDIARARFDAGVIDYLKLLEAQRSLYQAQDHQIAARQGQVSAFVQLRKALVS